MFASDEFIICKCENNSIVKILADLPAAPETITTYVFPGDAPSTEGRAILFDASGIGSWSQPLLTASTPQFARLGIGAAAHENILGLLQADNSSILPMLQLRQDGSGDAAMRWTLGSGGASWAQGIDASDSARFKISYGASGNAALGTNDLAILSSVGDVGLNGDYNLGAASSVTTLTHRASSGNRQYGEWVGGISPAAGAIASYYLFLNSYGGVLRYLGGIAGAFDTSTTTGQLIFYTSSLGTTVRAVARLSSAGAFIPSIASYFYTQYLGTSSAPWGRLYLSENHNTTTPELYLDQQGVGDSAARFALGSTISYAVGIDNSESGDPFKIAAAASGNAILGTGDIVWLTSAGNLSIGTGAAPASRLDIGAGAITLAEMTAPSAPSADTVCIYAEDDGTGKTRLMARFASGSPVQIAIQP